MAPHHLVHQIVEPEWHRRSSVLLGLSAQSFRAVCCGTNLAMFFGEMLHGSTRCRRSCDAATDLDFGGPLSKRWRRHHQPASAAGTLATAEIAAAKVAPDQVSFGFEARV